MVAVVVLPLRSHQARPHRREKKTEGGVRRKARLDRRITNALGDVSAALADLRLLVDAEHRRIRSPGMRADLWALELWAKEAQARITAEMDHCDAVSGEEHPF